jgi:hypothetical protein
MDILCLSVTFRLMNFSINPFPLMKDQQEPSLWASRRPKENIVGAVGLIFNSLCSSVVCFKVGNNVVALKSVADYILSVVWF